MDNQTDDPSPARRPSPLCDMCGNDAEWVLHYDVFGTFVRACDDHLKRSLRAASGVMIRVEDLLGKGSSQSPGASPPGDT